MEHHAESALAGEFCERSIHHLRVEFLPRIERAITRLGDEDLWWRPNPECTSAGNLLLHLEGNVRQWILSGLAEHADERVRSSEFEAIDGNESAALLARLRSTVQEACDVIRNADKAVLLQRHDIQIFEGVTGLAAILHVVEHFSWHTGQIAWITKMRTGQDLEYYEDDLLE
jgi:uncharacterized damage-inducible protein DinB